MIKNYKDICKDSPTFELVKHTCDIGSSQAEDALSITEIGPQLNPNRSAICFRSLFRFSIDGFGTNNNSITCSETVL